MKRDSFIDQLILLHEEFERVLNRIFGKSTEKEGEEGVLLFPEFDMYETQTSVIITFEIPGVKQEDLNIYTSENSVIVEGLKKTGEEGDIKTSTGKSFLIAERIFGKFRRVVDIPVACNMRDAKAILKNGILRVELNKLADKRKKFYKIPVEYKE